MTLHVSKDSRGRGVISITRKGQLPQPICVVGSVEEARDYVKSIEPEFNRLAGLIPARDHTAAALEKAGFKL